MNIAFQAQGKVIGLHTQVAFISIGNQLVFRGSVDTQNTTLTEVLLNKEWGVDDILLYFEFHKALNKSFSFDILKTPRLISLELKYDIKEGEEAPSLYCNAVLAQDAKQLAFSIRTEAFKSSENAFEKFIYSVMDFLAIKNLALVIRSAADAQINKYLRENTRRYLPDTISQDKYNSYGVLVNAAFRLKDNNSPLGKGLYTLTGLDEFQLLVGSALDAQEFEAVLFAEHIDKGSFIINRLEFGIKKDISIRIAARGELSFVLDKNKFDFVIAGEVSPTSFTLSASSKNKIPLNDRIFISDLGLVIGVSAGVIFGMTGRATVSASSGYVLSIFAGFVIDIATPKVNLLTAALSSTSGKISLKDIVVEIAEVEFAGVEALDIISLQDFDLNNTKINNWKKDDTPENIVTNFNSSIAPEFALSSGKDIQLTMLGDNQVILTDTTTMRHFRVDGKGVVSLNCQIYTALQPVQIGQYSMPAGFFLCGTLELFGVKVRSLFMVEPKNSVIALVEASAIKIGDVLELRRSNKSLPMEPINGGLAGALVTRSAEGPVFYFHVNKNKKLIELYLSAYLNIANIFKLDTLVLLKDRRIYIDTQIEWVGFSLLVKLDADYTSFSNGSFKTTVVFDTSGFVQLLEAAQQRIKEAAISVQDSTRKALRSLEQAKADVLKLNNQLNEYNATIRELDHRGNSAPWYEVGEKIACAAQIVYFESLKVGVTVALGVAYGALEVAQAAVRFGGDTAALVLEGVANIIASITKILWINRFELELEASGKVQKLRALLEITAFGNRMRLEGEIDIKKAIDDLAAIVTDFVKGKLTGQSDQMIRDIEDGNIPKRALRGANQGDFNKMFQEAPQNRDLFHALLDYHSLVEDFIVESNLVYQNAYERKPEGWQKNIVALTEIKMQVEVVQNQYIGIFDNEFADHLEQVIAIVRENHPKDETFIELDTKMTNLASVVRTINAPNNLKASRRPKPLFARMESTFEEHMQPKRVRLAKRAVDKVDADTRYIDKLADLLNNTFPETTNDYIANFKNTVAEAIEQFRNPPRNNERE